MRKNANKPCAAATIHGENEKFAFCHTEWLFNGLMDNFDNGLLGQGELGSLKSDALPLFRSKQETRLHAPAELMGPQGIMGVGSCAS